MLRPDKVVAGATNKRNLRVPGGYFVPVTVLFKQFLAGVAPGIRTKILFIGSSVKTAAGSFQEVNAHETLVL